MEKLKRAAGNLPTAARPTPAESNSQHTALKESRAMEAAYATLTDAFALEYEDDGMACDFVDHRDPAQVEELRLELSSIDDTEELSREFLRESWWWFPELHDEFRRACSGKGELSRVLAWAAGFERYCVPYPCCSPALNLSLRKVEGKFSRGLGVGQVEGW